MDAVEALHVLFEFLRSLLPEQTAAAALALVPVVVAVVRLARLIPWVEERRQWFAPLLSVLLGLIAGWVVAPGDWRLALPAGLLVGLAAVGGWSAGKNVAQAAAEQGQKAA